MFSCTIILRPNFVELCLVKEVKLNLHANLLHARNGRQKVVYAKNSVLII